MNPKKSFQERRLRTLKSRYTFALSTAAATLSRRKLIVTAFIWPKPNSRVTSRHPHMLRHSYGFYLANRGQDLRLIQDYLGHRDPKHTVHYTRIAGSRFEGLWR